METLPPQIRLGNNGHTYASTLADHVVSRGGVVVESGAHTILVLTLVNHDLHSPLAALEMGLRFSEDAEPTIAVTAIPRNYDVLKKGMEKTGLLREAGQPASVRFVAQKNGVWIDEPLPLRWNPNRPEDHAEFICKKARIAENLLEKSIVTFNSPDYFDAEKGHFVVPFKDQLRRMESKLKSLRNETGFDNPDLAKFIAALKTNGLATYLSELGFASAPIANQPLISVGSRNK